jgi:hypothetical protein
MIVAYPQIATTAAIPLSCFGGTPIGGAEFKVEGLPRQWTADLLSGEAIAIVGNPFDGTLLKLLGPRGDG